MGGITKMALPHTLNGIIGTMVFIVFVLILVAPGLNTDESKHINELQNNYLNGLNTSVNASSTSSGGFWGFIGNATGLSGYYDFLIGFFQNIINFIQLALAYMGFMNSALGTIPSGFYIVLVLMSIGLVVAILKLVRGTGD
jgi:hypothetical protein